MFKYLFSSRRVFLISLISILGITVGGIYWNWFRVKGIEGAWYWSNSIKTEALVFSREGVVVLKVFDHHKNPKLMNFSLEEGIPGRYGIEGDNLLIQWPNRSLPLAYVIQKDGNILYPDEGRNGLEKKLYTRDLQFKTNAELGDLNDQDKASEDRFLAALQKLDDDFARTVTDTETGKITAEEAEKRIAEQKRELEKEYAKLPNQVSENVRQQHSELNRKLSDPEQTVGPFISYRRAETAYHQFLNDWEKKRFPTMADAQSALRRLGELINVFRNIYNTFKKKNPDNGAVNRWAEILRKLQDGFVKNVQMVDQTLDERQKAAESNPDVPVRSETPSSSPPIPKATHFAFGGVVCPYRCSDGGWVFKGAKSGDVVKCQKCGKPFSIP